MADVNDIIRATLVYNSPGASEQNNVFYWVLGNAPIDNDDLLDALANWALTVWGPQWAQLAADVSTLVSVLVDIMNADGTVKENVGAELIGLDGDNSFDVTAAAVSGYLLAQTDNPKIRGSKYVPGISETQITNGVFTVSALAELALLLGIYLANIDLAGGGKLFPGVLSRTLLTHVTFNQSGLINDIPAYQRRRKEGVGS